MKEKTEKDTACPVLGYPIPSIQASHQRFLSFGLFVDWFLGWFRLAGADLLWEENTVG